MSLFDDALFVWALVAVGVLIVCAVLELFKAQR